jgi:DNA gyrase/topoisomerase IV subunit A
MATNIPPHNLGELVDALSVIIQNPEATVSILSLSPFRSIDFRLLIAS